MNCPALAIVAWLGLAAAESRPSRDQCPSAPEIFGPADVLLACQVTQQVEWNYPLRLPRYPFAVKDAAVEGDVLLGFIVDTSGAIEPASIRILRSTHDMYSMAATTAIRSWRGKAARMEGNTVRVYVQQGFLFRARAASSCEWRGAREMPGGLLACR